VSHTATRLLLPAVASPARSAGAEGMLAIQQRGRLEAGQVSLHWQDGAGGGKRRRQPLAPSKRPGATLRLHGRLASSISTST
jgi:hypothetical protein